MNHTIYTISCPCIKKDIRAVVINDVPWLFAYDLVAPFEGDDFSNVDWIETVILNCYAHAKRRDIANKNSLKKLDGFVPVYEAYIVNDVMTYELCNHSLKHGIKMDHDTYEWLTDTIWNKAYALENNIQYV